MFALAATLAAFAAASGFFCFCGSVSIKARNICVYALVMAASPFGRRRPCRAPGHVRLGPSLLDRSGLANGHIERRTLSSSNRHPLADGRASAAQCALHVRRVSDAMAHKTKINRFGRIAAALDVMALERRYNATPRATRFRPPALAGFAIGAHKAVSPAHEGRAGTRSPLAGETLAISLKPALTQARLFARGVNVLCLRQGPLETSRFGAMARAERCKASAARVVRDCFTRMHVPPAARLVAQRLKASDAVGGCSAFSHGSDPPAPGPGATRAHDQKRAYPRRGACSLRGVIRERKTPWLIGVQIANRGVRPLGRKTCREPPRCDRKDRVKGGVDRMGCVSLSPCVYPRPCEPWLFPLRRNEAATPPYAYTFAP